MCLHFVVREGGLHELGRAGERLCSREVGMLGKFSTLELRRRVGLLCPGEVVIRQIGPTCPVEDGVEMQGYLSACER